MKIGYFLTFGVALFKFQANAYYYLFTTSPTADSNTLYIAADIYNDADEKVAYYVPSVMESTGYHSFKSLESLLNEPDYPSSVLTFVDNAPSSIQVLATHYMCNVVSSNADFSKYKCYIPSHPAATDEDNTTTIKTTTTTTVTTKAAETSISGTCLGKLKGKKNGNGYKGYCCSTSDDCRESCIKGKCNGPSAPLLSTKTTAKTTQKSTKVATKATTKKSTTRKSTKKVTTTNNCLSGAKGKGKGNGKSNYCCTSSDDCKESCVKGKCTF